jgi:hypothetical protein
MKAYIARFPGEPGSQRITINKKNQIITQNKTVSLKISKIEMARRFGSNHQQ